MVIVGSYRKAMTSGTIAAGLTAASLVYAFKWAPTPSGMLCAVRRITVGAGSVVGFAAGFINLQAFVTRSYNAIEATGGTAGTFTTSNAKLASSSPVSAGATCYMTTTAAISGGVHVDDTDPFSQCALSVTTTGGAPPIPALTELFRAAPGEAPLTLANVEGFVIKATVPATGTWQLGVTVDWDELS